MEIIDGLDRLTDEARWLELQLGLTVSKAIAIDPPPPPISRAVVRRAIRCCLESRGIDPGPLRPWRAGRSPTGSNPLNFKCNLTL